MLAFVLNNQQVTHVCDLHWDHFVCHNNHLKVPTNQARLDLSQQLWGTSALIANRKNSEETFHKCYIFLLQHLTLLVNRAPHSLGHVMHCHCHISCVHSWQTEARIIKGLLALSFWLAERVVTAAHPSAWALYIHQDQVGQVPVYI